MISHYQPEEFPQLKDEEITVNEEVPTKEEIKPVLNTFKNGKSGGTDKLKTEGLKYNNSEHLLRLILVLMTLIWTLVKVPSVWLHSTITCLFKKGKMSLAENYRGLSIGANMSRILAKIVLNRLKEAYEKHIGEEQYGFRQNRSTSDGIFIIKNVIEKYSEVTIAVYIDLTAAYDHVPRDFLFKVLEFRTGAKHLIAILKKMYEDTTASIQGMTAKFDVLIGCRQGGQESPCLFNYYFDYVLKVSAIEIDKAYPDGWGISFEYEIPHWCSNREQRSRGKLRGIEIIRWILYADDVVLFCKTIKEAEDLLNIINKTCNRFGLTISFKKTKTQVFHENELTKRETLFSIDGTEIENIQQFTYLGQVISNNKEVCFTDHRTDRAIAKFNELRNILTDHRVNMRTRRKLLESCVRSRLTYATQAWYPNEQQMKKLEVCWLQCLRGMVQGGWRRKGDNNDNEEDFRLVYSNERIQEIVGTQPLKNHINKQYLNYIGHICRGENTGLTKKMMFAKATRGYYRDPWIKISSLLNVSIEQAKRSTQSRNKFAELVRKCTTPPP